MNPMTITCRDRNRILEDDTPAEWAALEMHAAVCPGCAEELRVWKSLSTAAQDLRDHTESPTLWLRIERALAEQAVRHPQRPKRWGWLFFWRTVPLGWQTAVGGVFVLLLMASAGWVYLHQTKSSPASPNPLLRSRTLSEVERTENDYVHAINKLASEAKPQLESPTSPLLASYQEKLLVLDSGIDDLRAEVGQNPSNAHLRYQLLAMYQEKQSTLEEILEQER
jgi:hypothetical protein